MTTDDKFQKFKSHKNDAKFKFNSLRELPHYKRKIKFIQSSIWKFHTNQNRSTHIQILTQLYEDTENNEKPQRPDDLY